MCISISICMYMCLYLYLFISWFLCLHIYIHVFVSYLFHREYALLWCDHCWSFSVTFWRYVFSNYLPIFLLPFYRWRVSIGTLSARWISHGSTQSSVSLFSHYHLFFFIILVYVRIYSFLMPKLWNCIDVWSTFLSVFSFFIYYIITWCSCFHADAVQFLDSYLSSKYWQAGSYLLGYSQRYIVYDDDAIYLHIYQYVLFAFQNWWRCISTLINQCLFYFFALYHQLIMIK
jgi:hypothetical protein